MCAFSPVVVLDFDVRANSQKNIILAKGTTEARLQLLDILEELSDEQGFGWPKNPIYLDHQGPWAMFKVDKPYLNLVYLRNSSGRMNVRNQVIQISSPVLNQFSLLHPEHLVVC